MIWANGERLFNRVNRLRMLLQRQQNVGQHPVCLAQEWVDRDRLSSKCNGLEVGLSGIWTPSRVALIVVGPAQLYHRHRELGIDVQGLLL